MKYREEIFGSCRLILGDCRDVLTDIGPYDAMVSDPPYVLTATGGGIGSRRQYLSDISGHIDNGFDLSVLSDTKNWLVFCARNQITSLITFAETRGLRWQILTWNKTNPTPLSNGNYLPDTEYMIHGFQRHDYECKRRFVVGCVERNDIDHPTVKPQYVMVKAVKSASKHGDLVIDPFMGSGSTGIACAATGRRFIGVEINPGYYEIACRRLDSFCRQGILFTDQPKAKQQGLFT